MCGWPSCSPSCASCLFTSVSAEQPRPEDTPGQLRAIFQPPAGRLAFGSGWPTQLAASVDASDNSTVLRGAVMAFESQHGLAMDGVASTALWQALLSARAHRQFNQGGYSYGGGAARAARSR